MNMMGHNSAAFGQMLKPILPVAPKAPKQRFPYFKFYPRDWIEATRDMTLEARGAYIDLICILMEMEGHLADNDSWISHQMHVSTRKWKSVKCQLVEHEKIRIEDGKIINERCLKELDQLLTQRRNLSGSALVRERTKRDPIVSQQRDDDENREKSNENNGSDTTVVPLRALASDSDLDKEERNPLLIPPEEGDAKPAKRSRGRGAKIRLAKDWVLDPGWRARTKEKFGALDAQIDREVERFRRYWTSPDAKNPMKADWLATWENWFDRAMERGIKTAGLKGDYSLSGNYVGKML